MPAGATVLSRSGPSSLYSRGGRLYGCLPSRTTALGALSATVPAPATRVARYVLRGPYAAIDTTEMGVDTFSSTVAVVDLRSGATIASAQATSPPRRPESFVSVAAMAIDPHGTLAWIGERSAIGVPTPTFEVHALTAAGNRLLASSAHIAPKSLRLHGETLTWQAGGQTTSTTL